MALLEIYDLGDPWTAFAEDLVGDDEELGGYLAHVTERLVDEHEAEAAAWGLL